MIFADPPYFLSDIGISYHSDKKVSVNKGQWDKALNFEERLDFNRRGLVYVK